MSTRSLRTAVALTIAAAGVSAGALYPRVVSARANETTISGNNLRDGWDQSEAGSSLLPATLKGGTFGELFAAQVDGQVYAQPIVVGGTLIVATENDWAYGLDPATGAVQWSTQLGTPWPAAAEHCNDLTPNVGVTGTPVYDPATKAVYLVAEQVPIGHTVNNPVFEMHALNPQTGAELPHWPVQIKGAPVNDPTVPMNPFDQLQRPGLLLRDGAVYAAFGSHCDFQPYRGFVAGVSTTSRSVTMWSDESGVANTQAGIWQSGGGLMSDGSGRIFLTSGNGISPPPGPGSNPPPELAESVVRLAVLKDGSLAARDFFSPSNAPHLDLLTVDGDLGSGAPVGLPFGTTKLPHLLLQAGKLDGLFVLNRDHLGGRKQGTGGRDAVVSETGKSLPGQWGHPAAFASAAVLTPADARASRDYVYYLGTGQSTAGAPLRYFKAGLGGPDGVTPVLTDVAQSQDTFGYTSGSPVVTSDGADPKTGVVWVVNSSGSAGTTGTLQAFPAVPPGTCSASKPCAVAPLWTSAPFTGAGKFTTPATDGGRVYIGTRGGQVLAYGSPSSAPLGNASPVNFGNVAVGAASGGQDVTITASASVTVSAVDTSAAAFGTAGTYQVNGVPATLPVTLSNGDMLTVQGVTFSPSAPGAATGSLQFHTDSANFPVVGLGLSGYGTQNGFYASSSTVDFGTQVPVGTTTQQQILLTNTESVPVTWTTTANPAAPFSVSGLPADGTSINPGNSVPLTISFQPANMSLATDTLTVTADNTTSTSITLTGTGAADVEPTLTASPASISFGSVPLGHNVQRVIDVANTGNLPTVITVTSPPHIPFGAPDLVASGLPVNPGYDVQIPVTFAPSSVGKVSDSYKLTWTDVNGSHQVSVGLAGTGVTPAGVGVPPPGGGWTFNGSARMAGSSLSLTQGATGQAGTAIYSVPEPANGVRATFTATLAGSANGMTFALLDASQAGPSAVGAGGAELGFGGIPGVAVALVTARQGHAYPSNSFVGIATGAKNGVLVFPPHATANVPGLRTGTHMVGVSVSGGTIVVTVDGRRVLSHTVDVPPAVRLAFTGGTGTQTGRYSVSGAAITAQAHQVPAPGGGWRYNGAAATSGSDTRLTPALAARAGAVVYRAPVSAVGLRAVFDVQIGGGSGGDGMTFALLDPARTSPRTLGAPGGMLGLGTSAGVPGLAVALVTDGPQSPAGFVATSVSTGPDGLRYQRKAQGIGMLTTGTHVVAVVVSKSSARGVVVTVFLDGVQVLQVAEPSLTAMVRPAFTAGTGPLTDKHIVRNVAISAPRANPLRRAAGIPVS
jgi:hypothetical protein